MSKKVVWEKLKDFKIVSAWDSTSSEPEICHVTGSSGNPTYGSVVFEHNKLTYISRNWYNHFSPDGGEAYKLAEALFLLLEGETRMHPSTSIRTVSYNEPEHHNYSVKLLVGDKTINISFATIKAIAASDDMTRRSVSIDEEVRQIVPTMHAR